VVSTLFMLWRSDQNRNLSQSAGANESMRALCAPDVFAEDLSEGTMCNPPRMRTYAEWAASPLEYALTKLLDLKPRRMCTYEKSTPGAPSDPPPSELTTLRLWRTSLERLPRP